MLPLEEFMCTRELSEAQRPSSESSDAGRGNPAYGATSAITPIICMRVWQAYTAPQTLRTPSQT